MPIPPILYHYCSNASLLEIVKSKTLLLTTATAANDAEETMRARPYVVEQLQRYTAQPENGWVKDLLEEKNKLALPPFIACFSENDDQLSQWRGYADDAAGVAIGFNTSCFGLQQKLPLALISTDSSQTAGIDQVIYNAEDQRGIISQIVADYLKARRANPNDKEVLFSAITQIWQFSLIFKNPGFNEEKEWRILNTPFLHSYPLGSPLKYDGAIGKRVSRIKGRKIVTSIELPLRKIDGNDPIAEVVLGPKNETRNSDLTNLFHEHDFLKVKVRRSAISYR